VGRGMNLGGVSVLCYESAIIWKERMRNRDRRIAELGLRQCVMPEEGGSGGSTDVLLE
jgi:hypothetical protein